MSERGCRQGGIPFSVMRRTKKGAGLFPDLWQGPVLHDCAVSAVLIFTTAILVFLAAAAGAGIVPPHRAVISDRFLRRFCTAVDVRVVRRGFAQMVFHNRLGNDVDAVHITDHIIDDGFLHGFEHFIGFELVFNQRITLSIGAQPNAFAQGIHGIEMFHPVGINNLQHDQVFQFAHDGSRVIFLAGIVVINRDLVEEGFQFITAHFLQFFFLQETGRRIKLLCIADEALDIPIFAVSLFWCIHIHGAVNNMACHVKDGLLEVCFSRIWRRWS